MTAIEELVYLLEEAFASPGIEATNESQSLLANLGTVEEAAWRALPKGGMRTIESIALHVGSCLVMCDDYMFGAGELTWVDLRVRPWPVGEAPIAGTIAWLQDVHDRFIDHVRGLADHAGELNHLRSILAADDAWRWG